MVIRVEDVAPETAQAVRGGEGCVIARRLLGPHPGSALAALGVNRLPPGSSIGLHGHTGEEDVYFCLEGAGVVVDDGREHAFTPGTLQICRSGGTQALRNPGPGDLVFLAALVKGA